MGAFLEEGKEMQLVVASDHDTLERPSIAIEESKKTFERGSTGIYIGRLNEIDDFSKFTLWIEASEPCFYFDRLDGKYIFGGQRGELFVQTYDGWVQTRLEKTIISYKGNIGNAYIFNDYIIVRK